MIISKNKNKFIININQIIHRNEMIISKNKNKKIKIKYFYLIGFLSLVNAFVMNQSI